MKPKNFPARKLERQLKAKFRAKKGVSMLLNPPMVQRLLDEARKIRTKKDRSGK